MTTGQQEEMKTAEILLQRVRELVPGLQERATRVEEMRSLPPETIDELRSAERGVSSPSHFLTHT